MPPAPLPCHRLRRPRRGLHAPSATALSSGVASRRCCLRARARSVGPSPLPVHACLPPLQARSLIKLRRHAPFLFEIVQTLTPRERKRQWNEAQRVERVRIQAELMLEMKRIEEEVERMSAEEQAEAMDDPDFSQNVEDLKEARDIMKAEWPKAPLHGSNAKRLAEG